MLKQNLFSLKSVLLLVLNLHFGLHLVAQPQIAPQLTQASPISQSPIGLMKAIGDRVISHTPFNFRLTVPQQKKEFDFVTYVDFARTFGIGKPAVAYAISTIQVQRDTTVTFEVSHNDGLVIMVNAKEVFRKEGPRKLNMQEKERNFVLESQFTTPLKRGNNTILVKSETRGAEWIFFIQPKDATIEFSPVKGLRLNSDALPGVGREVSMLSNWLVAGPFKPEAFVASGQIEQGFTIGTMYDGLTGPVTWQLPKIEIMGDYIGAHPQWGTYYSYNYHAAGVAWAMASLAKQSGDGKYQAFARKYCDFIIKEKPFINYQVNTLHGYRSAQHHQFNTPLLDFTTAPAMPFVYQLIDAEKQGNANFDTKKDYQVFVDSIKTYVMTHQVRLPDGTFTRETPEKYSTWVDDMFMGIPFLVHAALQSNKPEEKKKFFDEAAKQVLGFNKAVYDPQANLYMHAQYSARKAKLPYWSRANGWGIFAATEVLLHLPKNHPNYKAVMKIYQKHLDALVLKQDAKSGFWHQILDDPTSFDETSGTAIFTMALARGINNGWIDAKKYRPFAEKGWEALKTKIKPDGSVETICIGTMSSEDPNYYKTRPTVPDDSHGLLCVLFAGLEMENLLKGK